MEGKTRSHKFLADVGVNTHEQIDAYIEAGASKVLTSVVRNQTGETLTKGTVVYVSGASGNKPLVSKAQANTEPTSSKTYGVVKEDILTNSNGEAVFIGEVVGLDTLTYAEGSILWLSPTVAGGFTTTKPVAPNHAVYVALVTRNHQTQGAIEVRIANGYELEELHNVLITNPADGQVIAFDSADSLYKNITLTKANVGLSNVDNTSDLAKPVSTATQTALDGKQATLVSGTNLKTINSQSLLGSGDLVVNSTTNLSYTASTANGVVNSDTGTDATIPLVATNAGLMSPADKTKLDGIAAGATANSADGVLLARANHTGTQLASTISDFASTVRSTLITGVSFLTNATISATDNVLEALGKLQAQITGLVSTKQDTLVSGTNIKTLEGQSLIGSGNIDLTKSDVGLSEVLNVDTTTTFNISDSINKRFVTDSEKTILANTSGNNSGDQNIFSTIAVSGQSDVSPDTTSDTLTLVAGANITITTNPSSDSITISSTAAGGTDPVTAALIFG